MKKIKEIINIKFIRKIMLIDFIIFLTTGFICLIGEWNSLYYYSNALIWVGIIFVIIGFLKAFNSLGGTRDFDYQYSQSVGVDNIHERINKELDDSNQNLYILILFTVVGLISLGVGVLIQNMINYIPKG